MDGISKILKENNLSITRLIVQTACGANEESCGQFFVPRWLELQESEQKPEESSYLSLKILYKPPHFMTTMRLL